MSPEKISVDTGDSSSADRLPLAISTAGGHSVVVQVSCNFSLVLTSSRLGHFVPSGGTGQGISGLDTLIKSMSRFLCLVLFAIEILSFVLSDFFAKLFCRSRQ
jgi:hypothetical protein